MSKISVTDLGHGTLKDAGGNIYQSLDESLIMSEENGNLMRYPVMTNLAM